MPSMDGDTRLGPLSYEVHAPEGETSAERPIVVGIVVTVALLVLSLVGGWFTLGFVGNEHVVSRGFPFTIVVAAVGATAWTSRRVLRRARRNALFVVLAASLLAAVLANRSLGTIKPALPQVRRSLDQLHVPAGFTVVDESTHGDRFCHHGCPAVNRFYRAPAGDQNPVSTLILAMFDQGWSPISDIVEPKDATVAVKGGLTAELVQREGNVVEVSVQRDS
jgi:hypothetical protein